MSNPRLIFWSAVAGLPWMLAGALQAQTAALQALEYEIQNQAFQPAMIEASVGQVVRWTNRDLARHSVTSDDDSWTTAILAVGDAGAYIPNKAGVYAFHCKVHPRMKGVLVVK